MRNFRQIIRFIKKSQTSKALFRVRNNFVVKDMDNYTCKKALRNKNYHLLGIYTPDVKASQVKEDIETELEIMRRACFTNNHVHKPESRLEKLDRVILELFGDNRRAA